MLSERTQPPGHLDLGNSLQIPQGPPSPSYSTVSFMSSVTWMAEKTTTELIPLLKNAYSALKDKEKDLVLAAEIGKSLLEHNLRLKSSYESLLQSTTPPITPSCSTIPLEDSGIDSSDDESSSMRFVPSRGTREAMIEVLEKKNTELALKLESAMTEQDQLRTSNSKRTRQLENEISLLKGNLEIATTKIQELQDINQRQKKLEAANASISQQQQENDTLVDELYTEINKIKQEKEIVNQSKLELETKLANTLKDLAELKKQFEKFEFTQKDFDELQDAYKRQFDHIDELNHSLEDHRNLLQKLKERGINIHSTPAPSMFGGEVDDQKFRKNTLLGELESEWMKTNSPQLLPSFMIEKSLAAFYNMPSIGIESILSKATGIDPQLLDDALEFINQIEKEHIEEKLLCDKFDECDFGVLHDPYPSSGLYPSATKPELMQMQRFAEPKTFVGRLRVRIQKIFNLVWKWCRFIMILTTALVISAWQGPDSLLVTY
ncbi:uncharacterized protein B0P05DRAFT_549111 [Gilbertella persicaria]|uniref:uncharacterized protein n=1 Tax=Gilbertella persicaria TaxID=101096 RepID=UPI00221EAADA|nr:uncharacterized protein B0P05DRAFT_549111 [Gilbertella persicaria]KAI8072159.1 hypothetical protein B0P05DRAFT_549111 [Gilbertella persicaria]